MKSSLSDLAIFGGDPAFENHLHVGLPNLGDPRSFLRRAENILERRWFTNDGEYVQEFERRIADLLGSKHCIAVCNGTVALEIATRALEMSGEVIVPSFTFIATAHALYWQEIDPVFCDVDPATHSMDPNRVEELITPRTTGIVGVHVWGEPCAPEDFTRIAEEHGLKLVFDAAHAFFCSHNGTMIGNFGHCEVFSFHATKFFNTFEGGAVVTSDDELAAKIRLMKNFGFSGHDNVIYIGTNGKMTEICAAMGLAGLDGLEGFVAKNEANYEVYRRSLQGIPGITVFCVKKSERRNYQYVVLELAEDQSRISRDNLVKILHAEKVLARRYFYPGCHRMEPYRSYFPHAGLLLPETEKLVKRVILLPTGETIGEGDIEKIAHLIRFSIDHGEEISNRLGASAL